jgi:pyruvate,water dikinase
MLTPQETLGEPPIEGFDDPLLAALSKQDSQPISDDAMHAAVITGVPASPGVAHGRARVARSLAEASLIRPGEVLVCEMSLPTWTPLFAMIAAVVTDTGGVLSHSAIVARECGIPCVAGTHVATRRIQTGMLLTVDGSRGTVSIGFGSPGND